MKRIDELETMVELMLRCPDVATSAQLCWSCRERAAGLLKLSTTPNRRKAGESLSPSRSGSQE